MLFCPSCGNMLLIEGQPIKFYCATCPYICAVKGTYRKVVPLARKKVDDVLGGEEAWKNVDQTNASCPACGHDRAYFLQLQIRSADEPSTTFFRCTRCSKTYT